ncbi:MAG: hypothetical protein LPH21_15930 [Shewanella sp.]|nr:hypothetical protein [Shewanella sp.]
MDPSEAAEKFNVGTWVGKNIAMMTVGNRSGNNQHKRNSENLPDSKKEKTLDEAAKLLMSPKNIFALRLIKSTMTVTIS